MKAYQIFQESTDEFGKSIFQYLRDEQKEVYTASLSSLAQNRRLRPVFVQRKPAPRQIDWLLKNIRLKGSEEIAGNVLQLWLMKAHQKVLTDFLDGVGIEHDGEGAADDLPDKLPPKKLKSTIEKLVKDHDPEVVRLYLHVFQSQKEEGWPELTKLLDSMPELQFGAAVEEESDEEE
ncbi:MAG: hypothetical protein HKN23_00845 [Verrucomicrobiales bacterium]|nr:hypothetical protein [Verrucomicrobiales bacterium]